MGQVGAMTPIFTATVRGGKLVHADLNAVKRHLATLDGHDVEFTIKRKRSQRSLDQNAYLHGCVFGPLGEHLGYTMSEMKLLMMGECFGWQTVAGHELPIKSSTSEMTVEEAHHLIEWVGPWALEQFDFHIPLPNEVDDDDDI